MRIDISERQIQEAISAIRRLDSIDFWEISDGNKQSDLNFIIGVLNDFECALEGEII